MNIRKLAWKNLLRRKSRAVFTGLGIFLGIATFVAISSITSQMEGAVQDQLDRFGANIVVSPRAEQLSLGFGNIALGGTEVAHSRLTMGDKETRIFLRADQEVAYGPLMEVMNLMRKAGYLKIALVGLEKPPPQ